MGISFSYRCVSAREFTKILEDKEYGEIFLYGMTMKEMQYYEDIDDEETISSIFDKHQREFQKPNKYLLIGYWQAIHFLLTNEYCSVGRSKTSAPLCNLIMGGKEIDYYYKWSHHPGKIRYLTTTEVTEVANCINKINLDDLAKRYNCEDFNKYHIHPHGYGDCWKESDINNILRDFQLVYKFFEVSANNADFMLLSRE